MSTMTVDQRMDALRRANEIRSRRAQLKRDIRAGKVQAIDIIAEPPAWTGTMRVAELLKATPQIADKMAGRLLERAGVPITATLSVLTARQRLVLGANVGHREPRAFASTGGVWQPAMTVANTIRLERWKMRVEVAALSPEQGRERIASLLKDPPGCLMSMRVADLLTWADRVGPFHAHRFMGAARVSSSRTVDLTTERQRQALAACLRGNMDLVRHDADVREWSARAAA